MALNTRTFVSLSNIQAGLSSRIIRLIFCTFNHSKNHRKTVVIAQNILKKEKIWLKTNWFESFTSDFELINCIAKNKN